MAEARDRLQRTVDPSETFSRRRSSALGIPVNDPDTALNSFGPPAPWRTLANRGTGRVRRGGFGTPRMGSQRRRILYGSSSSGRENTPRRRIRGRATSSALPSWYPRRALQDITAVVRAIERRRTRLREVEGREFETPALNERAQLSQIQAQQIETPLPPRTSILDTSSHASSAQLEHRTSVIPSSSTVEVKLIPPSVGKVPKILQGVTRQTAEESEFLTPQKKLLNSIDTVDKEVKEELQKLKATPSAKKADREKRVRTLMSMR